MGVLQELVVKLRGDISDFQQKMTDAQGKVKSAGESMKKVGAGLTAGVTVPIIGMGLAGIAASTQFNAGMANVASLMPGNTKRVGELKTAVQDMAVQFGVSTDDLTAGLYQLTSAFGDDADSVKRLAIETKAAKAGLATVSDAIALTSAVTKGYGDTSAAAVQHSSDLALMTVRLGQTTFPELAQSIGLVVPLSSNLKIKQEELFAVMATGAGVTGTASQVATQYRGILQSLMAPTADMSGLFKKMGVANGEALIKQYGSVGAIKKITDAAAASGKPLQSYIGSIEGQTLALALSGPLAKTYAANLDQMGQSAGATDAAFAEQTGGINAAGFAMSQAAQEAQVTAQHLGDALAPAIIAAAKAAMPLVDFIGQAVKWFQNLPGPAQAVIGVLVGLAAAAGPVLVGLGFILPALSAIIPILLGVVGAVAGFAAALAGLPLILIVAGVVALVAGIMLLITHWQQVTNAIGGSQVFTALTQILGIAWTALQQVGAIIAAQVAPILAQLGATLRDQLMPAWGNLTAAFDVAKPLLIVIAGIVGGVLAAAFGLAISIIAGLAGALGGLLSAVIAVVGGIIQILAGWVQFVIGLFQFLLGFIVGLFTGDWSGMEAGLKTMQAGVMGIWNGIKTAIVGLVTGLIGAVGGLFNGFVSTIVGFFTHLWEVLVGHSIVPDMVNGIVSWIAQLPGRVGAFILQLITTGIALFENLRALAVSKVQALVVMAEAIAARLKDALTAPIRAAKDIIGGILGNLAGMFAGLHLDLPHINLPHFHISGSFSLNPPSIPSIGVDWYAKGGIFTQPTIAGIGEAGPEAVIPLDRIHSLVNDGGGGRSGGSGGSLDELVARILAAGPAGDPARRPHHYTRVLARARRRAEARRRDT
jgi:TP901 family phage tail tape measure protein